MNLKTLEEAFETSQSEQVPQGPTDWFYRHCVPKDLAGNLRFREILLNAVTSSDAIAEEVWIACSRDILFYINTFGYTLNPRLSNPLIPFLTYGYQDSTILELERLLGHEDVALPKSRDMGASWICLLVMEHAWHFKNLQQFLLTSWKEELVDGPSEKTLFSKLDFWWQRLPGFLQPKMKRNNFHCSNLENGSSFDGEATVESLGSGDRRTAILLDETSKMPNAGAIFTSTQAVTDCRIFNSTPNGRFGIGEAFYKKIRNPNQRKIWMHWSDHPSKRRGLYKMKNGVRTPLPDSYNWHDDYDKVSLQWKNPAEKPRSEWYDKQVLRAQSPIEIAQECDIDFLGSSIRFADPVVISTVKEAMCRDPKWSCDISADPEDFTITTIRQPRGQMAFWVELVNGKPPHGEYAVGVDVSAGTGGELTSESCISVWDRKTKEQVAEFASRTTKPDKLAILSVAIAKWFNDAFLVPEVNGPVGKLYVDEFRKLDYSNVYHREVMETFAVKQTKKIGYRNGDGGAAILQSLHSAIDSGEAKLRSSLVADQMLEYEWDGGNLKHAASGNSASESEKGLAHGDRAIAAAMGWLGVCRRPVEDDRKESSPEDDMPVGCMAWRFKQREETRERSATDDPMVFD